MRCTAQCGAARQREFWEGVVPGDALSLVVIDSCLCAPDDPLPAARPMLKVDGGNPFVDRRCRRRRSV
jgi:hypothetical protein